MIGGHVWPVIDETYNPRHTLSVEIPYIGEGKAIDMLCKGKRDNNTPRYTFIKIQAGKAVDIA